MGRPAAATDPAQPRRSIVLQESHLFKPRIDRRTPASWVFVSRNMRNIQGSVASGSEPTDANANYEGASPGNPLCASLSYLVLTDSGAAISAQQAIDSVDLLRQT